jgi:L-threonylcarbamoyladenylate synthase
LQSIEGPIEGPIEAPRATLSQDVLGDVLLLAQPRVILIEMLPIDTAELIHARDRLLAGDVVAMPTETVYGLAAAISKHEGLKKIFSLKERPYFDPLIVHVGSFKQAISVVKEWPPLADFLARSFWPGPLTLVLPKADHIDSIITSGLDTVAVRLPAHPLAQDLIRITGCPLAAPSANKFGRTSPSTAQHVRSEFPDFDLFILDGGPCEIGLESTVVSLEANTSSGSSVNNETILRILRPGGITEEQIRTALTKWGQPVQITKAESTASPGHLKHHYMPKIPLVIVKASASSGLSRLTLEQIQRDLKLSEVKNPLELKLSDTPSEAARELYSQMRFLCESGADLLYVRATPERSSGGLWDAIWDRLTRAASLNLTV